jgi:hypothetical protein
MFFTFILANFNSHYVKVIFLETTELMDPNCAEIIIGTSLKNIAPLVEQKSMM